MKKAAFAVWNNRIAPVFDVARHLHLVEAESGRIIRETETSLADELPAQRALRLVEWKINVLVCGAISRPFQEMLATFGIRVISFIAGDLSDVVQMWVSGASKWSEFSMPGCGRRGHRRGTAMPDYFQEGNIMPGRNRNGMKGGGRRMGNSAGQGSGRRGPDTGAGPAARCICPQCGETRPHQRGAPCYEQTCPKCGSQMIRG